jgi:hypothetical protein
MLVPKRPGLLALFRSMALAEVHRRSGPIPAAPVHETRASSSGGVRRVSVPDRAICARTLWHP